MKKITIIIDDEDEDVKQHIGHLELDNEAIEHFEMIGIDAIEHSIVEVIRRMLENTPRKE